MKTITNILPNPLPQIGMGVTIGIGSDCYPATIIHVSKNFRKVTIQHDKYTPTDGYEYYKNQVYEYKRDTLGAIEVWTYRKRGIWAQLNSAKAIGYLSFNGRRAYQDPSF